MGSIWKNLLLVFSIFMAWLSPLGLVGLTVLDFPQTITNILMQSAFLLVSVSNIAIVIWVGIDSNNIQKKYPDEKMNPVYAILGVLFFSLLGFLSYLFFRDKIMEKHNQLKPILSKNKFTALILGLITITVLSIGTPLLIVFANREELAARYQAEETKTNTEVNENVNENTNISENKNVNLTNANTAAEPDLVNINENVNENKNVNLNANTARTASIYNECFFLVKTSENCEFKTAVPVRTYDYDQDNIIGVNEASIGTTNNNIDSDGDGIPDGLEVAQHTDPLSVENTAIDKQSFSPEYISPYDEDFDGIHFTYENAIGTDPNNPDSDGDGFNDGEEAIKGYNPLGQGMVEYEYETTEEWVQATGFK